MTPKEIQDKVFKAISEAHKKIGNYTRHRGETDIMKLNGKILDTIAIKHGISPTHIHNVYFGKR
jgi:hypothetical protein